MYQAGCGVAHIKEQYIATNQSVDDSKSTTSATGVATTATPIDTSTNITTNSTTTISKSSVPTSTSTGPNTIRARTKEQLGLVDHTGNYKNSGVNMEDVQNVLVKEVMVSLRKHDYKFIEGTAEKGNKRAKGHKKKVTKKRSSAPMHCYQFLKSGACTFGDTCRYKHLNEQELKSLDDRTEAELTEKAEMTEGAKEVSVKKESSTSSTSTSTSASTSTSTSTTATTAPTTSTTATATTAATTTTTTTTNSTTTLPSPAPLFRERKAIDFRHKVYVGPLTTLGNLPYRRVMKGFGTDITCGEMAIAQNVLKGSKSEWALLRRHKCEDVFGIQVAGGDHRMMDRLAQVVENELSVDFVDLNMGCPLDFICGKGMGSKLMTRVKRVKDIVRCMSSRLSVPMTLKLRTGWSNDKPMADSLLHQVPLWNVELSQSRSGGPTIQAVTIHGRSRLQRYKNLANWDFIRKCSRDQEVGRTEMVNSTTASSLKNNLDDVPRAAVIGNGDVYSFTDWNRELASGELDTCMLARGALIKPWLPKEIKEQRHWDISANERLDVLKDFVRFGLEYWGSDASGVSRCRRFLLEWQSFLHRYIPLGLLERIPHQMNERPPRFICRNDLETMLASQDSRDWVKITELAGLPPPPADYKFTPKHRANAYANIDHQQQVASVSVLASTEQTQEEAPPPHKKMKLEK